jgi:hypothetical protein
MTKNALIDEVRDAFMAQQVDQDAARDLVYSFCAFANSWLNDKRVIGVGQTVEGFAVRVADGSEYLLTVSPELVDVGTSVSISGLAGRGDRVSVNNTQVQITGNKG